MQSSPWKSIWFEPQKAFAQLAQLDPRYMRYFFAIIIGLSSAVYMMGHVTTNLGEWGRLFAILLSVICYPFITLGFFHLCGWVLWKVSTWCKGSATLDQAKSVFVWSNAPGLINFIFILLNVVVLKSIGMNVLFGSTNVIEAARQIPFLNGVTVAAALITYLWSIYIYVNGIAAINNFKFGKTALVWFISAVINTAIITAIAAVLAVVVTFFGGLYQ